MSSFEVRQCTNPVCRLRLPVDMEIHSGKYCPKCGDPLEGVEVLHNQPVGKYEQASDRRELVVVLDNIRSAHNVGSIFRTADGAGVKHLYLCGITPTPAENQTLGKTSLGSENFIPWSSHLNAVDLAEQLISNGYSLLALEQKKNAVSIFQFKIEDEMGMGRSPLALILGNERAGVDPELMDLGEAVLTLPMAGQKASLNVAVAFGVAAYWLMNT